MKKYFKIYVFFILAINSIHSSFDDYNPPEIYPSENLQTQNAVTYTLSGGRFGDNLIAYFHAKWIAMKYNLPFLQLPFTYSDKLNLDMLDQKIGESYLFKNQITLTDESQIDTNPSSTLYIIPYFPEVAFERTQFALMFPNLAGFQVDWNDPSYKKEIEKCLTPKENIEIIKLPKRKITVAVHLRTPRGEGCADVFMSWPLKFPPESYYVDQLKKVLKKYPKKEFYVYLFTDDPLPFELLSRYKHIFRKHPRMQFDYKISKNDSLSAMFTDFYSMGKFDVLIGCGSNFSIAASFLGDYDLKILPSHFLFEQGSVTIDKVEIHYRSKKTGTVKIIEMDN